MGVRDEELERERMKYGQFVELLNRVRGEDLITAERRRELDRRWRTDPENRDGVLEELEVIIERHSESLIQGGP